MPKPKLAKPHDRRATQLPHNARIATDQVEDPYDPTASLLVIRSLRDDQLATMLARAQITRCQFQAGRQWQSLWHQAEVGSPSSIDPRKLRVDGRGPSSDARRIRAIARLDRISTHIGRSGDALLHDILVAGMTLRNVAAARRLDPRPGSNDLIYLGRRLRECLDTVAKELRLA